MTHINLRAFSSAELLERRWREREREIWLKNWPGQECGNMMSRPSLVSHVQQALYLDAPGRNTASCNAGDYRLYAGTSETVARFLEGSLVQTHPSVILGYSDHNGMILGSWWDKENNGIIEGSLEVKLPTIWTDEKQSRAEAERRERLEERRVEEKESEERRYRCAKR